MIGMMVEMSGKFLEECIGESVVEVFNGVLDGGLIVGGKIGFEEVSVVGLEGLCENSGEGLV